MKACSISWRIETKAVLIAFVLSALFVVCTFSLTFALIGSALFYHFRGFSFTEEVVILSSGSDSSNEDIILILQIAVAKREEDLVLRMVRNSLN
jgi:hypothetical protein